MQVFDVSTGNGKICSAAVDLFYKKGYHATGMRELASVLGMTVANLYNFFPSKEVLLNQVLERIMTVFIDNVSRAIDLNADPVTQLTAGITASIRFHGENQKEALVSDSELRGLQGEMLHRVLDYRDKFEREFRGILDRGIQSGCFAPVNSKLTAIAILTMCTQVAYWYRPQGEWPLKDIAQNYCNFVLTGLSPV